MDHREFIINLGTTLAREEETLNELWTWLPSCAHAYKVYGEHALEHRPPLEHLAKEASKVFWVLGNAYIDPAEAMAWFSCEDAVVRDAFPPETWTLDDVQAFFKRQYGAHIAFWRGDKAEAG